MGEMLKQDALGYYNVKVDDETGEVLFDPRAPVKVEEAVKPTTGLKQVGTPIKG